LTEGFYRRLHSYFLEVGKVLRNESSVANIFPNTTDRGMSRENIYAEVLRDHLPPICNIKLGGFVFGLNGDESKQIDLIISNDKSIQFDHLLARDGGKSFSCIEGCIGVVSVKSTLDKKELYDSLENLASLPEKRRLGNKNLIGREVLHYEDWPYKVIFASNGINPETLIKHLNSYYSQNPKVPIRNRPNLIYVAGSCNIVRVMDENTKLRNGEEVFKDQFHLQVESPDVFGIGSAIADMQAIAMASNFIAYEYSEIINNLPSA